MSISPETVLVKAPHRRETFTEEQLTEFMLCADQDTGPLYFMDNFFYIQHPTRGKMLYHPFEYQKRLIDTYHNYKDQSLLDILIHSQNQYDYNLIPNYF